jgi:phosphatidate cytidylyltransferase
VGGEAVGVGAEEVDEEPGEVAEEWAEEPIEGVGEGVSVEEFAEEPGEAAEEWAEEPGEAAAEWAEEPVDEWVEEPVAKRRWWQRRKETAVWPEEEYEEYAEPAEEPIEGVGEGVSVEEFAEEPGEAAAEWAEEPMAGIDEGWLEEPVVEASPDRGDELFGEPPAVPEPEPTAESVDPPLVEAVEPRIPGDTDVPPEPEGITETEAEWQGDATAIPRAWFAEVDEDEVDVPPLEPADAEWADLPDTRKVGETLELFEPETGPPPPPPDTPMAPPAPADWEDRVDELVAEAGEVAPESSAEEVEEPVGDEESDDWFVDEDDEWSEEMYSGAVTTDHRGLAEAIDAAGTEEREWQALSAPMPGLETGVVGFEDVEDLGTDEEYVEPSRSDLGLRIVTGLILVGLLLGSLWAGGAALGLFIGLIIMIGLIEFYTTLRQRGYQPVALFGYLGGAGLLVASWFHGPIAVPAGVFLTAIVVFFFYAFAPQRRNAFTNGALTVLGVAWVAGTAAFAMPIVAAEEFRTLVIALVVATVAMDVGAYGFGRAWGSAPLAPILSPNKSIEGLAGGVVLAIGAALATGWLTEPTLDVRAGAALGLVVAVMAPLGDLAESMFKRSLGVKDMGTILPGHGGILDRVDAFLFVLPAAWVLYTAQGYLG